MASTVIRTAELTEAEQYLIGLLSPEERRTLLVTAGRAKQRRLEDELRSTMVDRVQRGQVAPLQIDPATGQRYDGLGQRITLPDMTGELENVGRVPDYPDYHVFRTPDGKLRVLTSQELEQRGQV